MHRVLGEADAAGLDHRLQPRRDVDAVAQKIAVGLHHDIAQVDSDAELDAALGIFGRVVLRDFALDRERAPYRVDHAAELGEHAVAGGVDDAAVIGGDGGIDQIAAQRA